MGGAEHAKQRERSWPEAVNAPQKRPYQKRRERDPERGEESKRKLRGPEDMRSEPTQAEV